MGKHIQSPSPHNSVQIGGGSAAATGAVEITPPVAIVAAMYIIGQGSVEAFGDSERKIASAVGKMALPIK